MILACKKNLVNKHKQVGLGQTPPPLYGKFSHLIPFFSEGVPYWVHSDLKLQNINFVYQTSLGEEGTIFANLIWAAIGQV